MKKIIMKVWGIGLIVTLLSSLLIVGAAPASGGTLVYSPVGLPNPVFPVASNQVSAGSDVSAIKVAPNGDIFAIDRGLGRILKSVDGGYTWAVAVLPAGFAMGAYGDIAISPSYDTDSTVFAVGQLGGAVVAIRSVNAGVTFQQYGGNIVVGGTLVGTSIALEPTYSGGVGTILVGTADTAGGAYGSVYAWGYLGALTWVTVGTVPLAEDVTSVAFSPLYPIDSTIFVVSTTIAGGVGTRLHAVITPGGIWDAIPAAVPPYPVALNASAGDIGSAGAIVSTSMAFPSDFNASNTLLRNLFIGTNSGAVAAPFDGVRRVNGSVATLLGPVAGADNNVTSVAFSGTYAGGKLTVGMAAAPLVYNCANPSAAPGAVTFSPFVNGVTGATLAYVAFSGTDTYVGTSGAGAPDESAFNVSSDGVNYRQRGLIDTVIGFYIDMDVVSSSEWYLVNSDGVGAAMESVWHTTNGGVQYVRVTAMAFPSGAAALALSQDFANDSTMYFYEVGATAGAPVLLLSNDAGNTWAARGTPPALAGAGAGITDLLAVDQYTLYIGGTVAGAIYKSVNNGWTYSTQALTAGGAVYQIRYDAGTGHILVGDTIGGIWLSTNGLTWAMQGPATGGSNMVIAFDANYGTNNTIYAGEYDPGTPALPGIWRFVVGGTAPWTRLDGDPVGGGAGSEVRIPAGLCAAIEVAPDGALYAVDGSVVTGAAGGIVRILVPTSPVNAGTGLETVPPPALITTAAPPVAGSAFGALQMAAGSNILYAVNTLTATIATYTDTLTTPIPSVIAPADGAIIATVGTGSGVTIQIEPVAGATGHQVQWSTRPDYLGAVGATVAFLGPPFNTAALAGVPAGATIYYRVRVITPLVGPWSQNYTFETQIAGGQAPNSPAIPPQPAANGGTGVSLTPNLVWGGVVGATGYELQLATDPEMSNLILDLTGENALGNVTSYLVTSPLDYSTVYYWRVKAIGLTSETFYSTVQAFTTMAEPAPTQPVVTVPPAPTPTIVLPTPTVVVPQQPTPTVIVNPPAEEKVSEVYIWVIIIIGAVLVITVIVLIVRTRRNV